MSTKRHPHPWPTNPSPSVTQVLSNMSKKGNDTPTSARIRENQRRSRNRRKELIEDLQKRVRDFEQKGVTATLEMQQSARYVAQENAGLRSLLARQGISEAQVNDYLRLFAGATELKKPSLGAAATSASCHERAWKKPLRSESRPSQPRGQDQFVGQPTSPELTVLQPGPALKSTDEVRLQDVSNSHHASNVQRKESATATTMIHHEDVQDHHQAGDDSLSTPGAEEPDCPNTADCFCPPSMPTTYQSPSHDLEISCEAAATIIVEMRGDGDMESARASLGCYGREECNVKNSTVLQIMDQG